MRTVNFKKYADIIVNLQMKNDSYYLIKRFDDDTLDHIRNQFDKEGGLNFMDRFNHLSDEIVQLQKESIPPESEKCQRIVEEYWGLIMEFTNGDMSMLLKLMEVGNRLQVLYHCHIFSNPQYIQEMSFFLLHLHRAEHKFLLFQFERYYFSR